MDKWISVISSYIDIAYTHVQGIRCCQSKYLSFPVTSFYSKAFVLTYETEGITDTCGKLRFGKSIVLH